MFHGVPRLDNPNKVWLLPAPVAKWLGIGLTLGPIYAQATEFWLGWPTGAAWDRGLTWVIWLVGLVVGVVGAFVRPGGHDLGHWLSVLLTYLFTPKRSIWRPTGG